jgi:hypothetical protein
MCESFLAAKTETLIELVLKDKDMPFIFHIRKMLKADSSRGLIHISTKSFYSATFSFSASSLLAVWKQCGYQVYMETGHQLAGVPSM